MAAGMSQLMKAVLWVKEQLDATPDKDKAMLTNEACVLFRLDPKDQLALEKSMEQ